MGNSWPHSKEHYTILAVRIAKTSSTMQDLFDIAKAMTKRKRLFPVNVARIALREYIYGWKRDHGLEIPPIKLNTR